jgi:hypothetical protein
MCHLHHKLIGFYNRDEKCLQLNMNWLSFVFIGLMCRNLLCTSEADFSLQHRKTKLVASLQESLRKEPTYMLEELDVYSMQDLA